MNPLFLTDSYKLSHKGFMTEGTEVIYSNGTARSSKYLPVIKEDFDDKVVWFGMQATLLALRDLWDTWFFKRPKSEVIAETKALFDAYLGEDAIEMSHFEELHDLGYLPIRVKSLPEGSRVNIKVPLFTIQNTNKRFAWLTNYLETYLSAQLWKPTTVATIIYQYRKLVNEYAMKTVGSLDGTEFQIHGFEFRGMSNWQDAAACAAGFLLSSRGTDTIPALPYITQYYSSDPSKEFIATSVPASEHSLASTGIAVNGELETYRKWITEDYPTGIVSIIADTLDFFRVVTEFATLLKDDILNRQPNALGLAKVVFRPDSGDPADIICGTVRHSYDSLENAIAELEEIHAASAGEDCEGSYNYGAESYSTTVFIKETNKYYRVETPFEYNRYDKKYYYIDSQGETTATEVEATPEMKGAVQCLWEIFGGTTNELGFKHLHERVGLIYGDSITLERAKNILQRLEAKGFASTNVVFGVGSFTCQYLSRDSLGIAVKATAAVVNGELYELSKDPKTDDGTKKSAKGLLRVEKEGDNFVLYDQQTLEQEHQGQLRTIFEDGVIWHLDVYREIRERLWS